jgi:hypothetical protein
LFLRLFCEDLKAAKMELGVRPWNFSGEVNALEFICHNKGTLENEFREGDGITENKH